MSSSSIRKALGAVKDQTTISLAKVSSTMAPDLDVAIVKATSHDDDPADEKHFREILSLTSHSRGHVSACVSTLSRRLSKTRDWIVALKSLVLVHRLLADGVPAFHHEILHRSTRRGARFLNLSAFRDEAHSSSWDHSAFVRSYALYLDQRLEIVLYQLKFSNSPVDDWNHHPKPPTPPRDMKPERMLGRMHQLQQLLDRFLACRPTGAAKTCRLILIALYPLVRESFQLYADICEMLSVLLDGFFDMDYAACVKSFEAYAGAAKQIDELAAFYVWCKDTGVARSSEYPEVQRITDKLLQTLEEFMRDRGKMMNSPPPRVEVRAVVSVVDEEEEEPVPVPVPDMNSIKALPAPLDYEDGVFEKKVEPEKPKQPEQQQEGDLLNLREDALLAEDQSNKLALALFSAGVSNSNGLWESFPSQGAPGEPEVTSAWQNPAAEPGKADWELALVETVSHLSKQKPTLGGGFDPLLLDGMYDQGTVRQHINAHMSVGSASSVALPGLGRSTTPVLALPAPDGTVQVIGQDPFAASLSIPPPSYVQMAEMEKKQQLLTQEQLLWQQYARAGMQGQTSLANLGNTYQYLNPAMPYGMHPINGNGGYYYQPY